MSLVQCKTCTKEFYVKPSHQLLGYGIYCSRNCAHIGVRTGKRVVCTTCGKETYREPRSLTRSKSGTFFCTKRCQTLWRNRLYIGEKHSNWTTGKSSYRNILKRVGGPRGCRLCGTSDERVLAVHHIDRVRTNNTPDNLMWLCHNCHFLIHHYDVGLDQGFLKPRP